MAKWDSWLRKTTKPMRASVPRQAEGVASRNFRRRSQCPSLATSTRASRLPKAPQAARSFACGLRNYAGHTVQYQSSSLIGTPTCPGANQHRPVRAKPRHCFRAREQGFRWSPGSSSIWHGSRTAAAVSPRRCACGGACGKTPGHSLGWAGAMVTLRNSDDLDAARPWPPRRKQISQRSRRADRMRLAGDAQWKFRGGGEALGGSPQAVAWLEAGLHGRHSGPDRVAPLRRGGGCRGALPLGGLAKRPIWRWMRRGSPQREAIRRSAAAVAICAHCAALAPRRHPGRGHRAGQTRRFDEADAVLADAAARMPNELIFALEAARLAHRRGALAEALERWATVAKLPGQASAYTGGAVVLRDLRQFDEAALLLQEAIRRSRTTPGCRGASVAGAATGPVGEGAATVGRPAGETAGRCHPDDRRYRGAAGAWPAGRGRGPRQ